MTTVMESSQPPSTSVGQWTPPATREMPTTAAHAAAMQVAAVRPVRLRSQGQMVLLGRFVAFLRATMPFLAGTAHMRYRTFLAYNAAGAVAAVGIAALIVFRIRQRRARS